MVCTLVSYEMKDINLSNSTMKEQKRSDDHCYLVLCTANFTLCLIYNKQDVTICANILKTLVMCTERKSSYTYCR